MPYTMGADAPFPWMLSRLMDTASFKRHTEPTLYPALARQLYAITCQNICFRYGKYPASRTILMQKPCCAFLYGDKSLAVSFRFLYGQAVVEKSISFTFKESASDTRKPQTYSILTSIGNTIGISVFVCFSESARLSASRIILFHSPSSKIYGT